MDIKAIKNLKCGKVHENVSLKNYTTYKLNEKASCLIEVEKVKHLEKLLKYIKGNNIKYKIIGNGSNLIFAQDFDGILIKLKDFNYLEIDDTKIKVGASYSLIKLCLKASNLGLTGLEFAAGIPATVGGAVYMNAGAYKSDMGYIVSEVDVLTPDFEHKTLYNHELNFHYRDSFFQHNSGYIILGCTIILKHGKKDDIISLIEDRKKRRLMTQPLEYPSAGSVFRNPTNDFAGRLIEEIGYKGKSIGDASVSLKHANFIINKGNAKGSDIVTLIDEIKEKVKKKYDIDLKVEQEIVK